ncbi:MAG TPA: 50S ribosomal protein L11 methyltransferase [Thermoanaerobaculia bacterium]
MSRARYSRLTVPRKSGDEVVLGLLSLHDPLGFEQAGRDLVAFYREAGAARRASESLRAARIRHALTTDILEGDPLESYRAVSRPFPVGRRLWIDPGDPSEAPPPEGRIVLRLPASRAFGTGAHESTRLALIALEEEALEGRSLLDAGTGSAVLALAGAALGARLAVGLDTDADAIFVARENIRRHSFGIRVRLFAGPLSACAGHFDLIVANMLPDEILSETRRLFARASRRGRVILSGVTRNRERDVLAKTRTARWKLAGRRTDKEWICLSLARVS